MTRIGNVDHVLMLLQKQLQKLNTADRKSRTQRTGGAGEAQSSSSLHRIAALSGIEGPSDEDFERLLVRALLVDELGEALAEDHRFDRIAREVHRIITNDEKTHSLLRDAARQARKPA